MAKPKSASSPYSLRIRLFVFLLAPLLALLSVSIVTDYREGMLIGNEAYDQALYSTAQAFFSVVDRDLADLSGASQQPSDPSPYAEVAEQVYYAVVDGDGTFLAGDEQMLSLIRNPAPGAANPDYRFDMFKGQKMRIVTWRRPPNEYTPQGAVIVVAETTRRRETSAFMVTMTTLFSDLLFISTSLLVIFVGIRYAHRPLSRISRQIVAREPKDLSPIDESAAPREIHALIHAMNRLMGNLREAGIAQQNFISSAAHQLRSPLAALQAQIDVAAEGQEGESLQRLRGIQASVIRLSRLTKQMLALARAAPDASQNVGQAQVALEELIENAASELIDQAVLAGIDLGFELAPAPVWGVAWSLREMLTNLVDNAVRYTGAGGIVTVRCGTGEEGGAWLEVEDNGPGIPEPLREKAFERFVRLGEVADGSGLGLAIVKEAALSHRARVEMFTGAEGRGLRVRVDFPRPSLG